MYATTLHLSVAKAFGRKERHMLLWTAPGMSTPRGSESEQVVWTVPAQGSWIYTTSALHV